MTICRQCQQDFPADQVVIIKDAPVCETCKPVFLTKLQEGTVDVHGFVYKGFWVRVGAKLLDYVISNVVAIVIGLVVGVILSSNEPLAGGIAMVLGMAWGFGYYIYFNGKFGATPGKMVIGAKIVNADGTPISYGKAAGRMFAEIVSALTLCFGYIMCGWDAQKRTLHDRICGTVVIQK